MTAIEPHEYYDKVVKPAMHKGIDDPVITLIGRLSTDGGTVYINGMDLAEILRAAIPHRPDPKYPAHETYGWVAVQVVIREGP